MSWRIDPEELAEWCRDVIAKYPPADVDLFIIRLGGKPAGPPALQRRLGIVKDVWK